jgi:XTP/dITP diphosphohydrolase
MLAGLTMQLLLATSNQHKLYEVRTILEPHGIKIIGLDSLEQTYEEPVEDADTFEGNARLKATGYAKATGKRCMADDSGLAVDALDGRPGVHSARFAGSEGDSAQRDEANNTLLLSQLKDVPSEQRTARFVCAICIAEPDGTIIGESKGLFEGLIATEPMGTNGFGYDPLLFVPSANKTSAQMTPEEKNICSHRGEAVRQIISHLGV